MNRLQKARMTASFDLSRFLPYQLAFVSERVSRRLSVDYNQSHGLTMAEWRVLVNLKRLGTASVRDIQVVTNLEKSRVSRAVARLETAKLVEKQASTRDARLVEIALTKQGEETLSTILPAAKEVEARLLEGLTEAQRSAFFEVVEHFHKVLDEDPEARPRLAVDR